ncbi:MAG: shikimate kinase [Roseivivax sp.]|nr:shikimate kinase [Roseivivax sp.]
MADTEIAGKAVLKKTVVLVGMMGAGKTAVGRALAGMVHAPFLDSDQEIERAANMTVSEIFERYGEPFFRQKESQVIDRLLDAQRGILSTGGGAFMFEGNRDMMSRKGVSVWLKADLELLWSRVRHKSTRPLLRGPDPYGTLRAIYEKRVPVYALADLTVEAHPSYSVEDMATKVLTALKSRPDVLEMTE